MDRHTMKAFEKLQKREHYLRMLNDRLERGLINQQMYEKEMADIFARYELTDEERRAYREYERQFKRSKRK